MNFSSNKTGIQAHEIKHSRVIGRDIYSGHPPPLGREREILSKLKNREEFEGGLKRPEEFEETSNKSPKKQGRISTGGENNFPGWPEYIPLS